MDDLITEIKARISYRREAKYEQKGKDGALSYSDHRVPEELGQESQASSCLRKGTPLASRVAQVRPRAL